MQVQRYDDPYDFVAKHTEQWLEREAEEGAFLRIKAGGDRAKLICLAVMDGESVLQTACVYCGDQIIFSRAAPEVLKVLVAYLCAQDIEIPGIFAPGPSSVCMAELYARARGKEFRVVKQLTHFALETLREVALCEGTFRKAVRSDREMVIAFRNGSQQEGNTQRPFDAAASVEKDLRDGSLFVWENKRREVVCTAALYWNRSVRSGHIDAVYTPPEQRRKGYARSLVFQLSKLVLERGLTPGLSTDVVNAAANRVYEGVGFVPQCQMDNIRFTA